MRVILARVGRLGIVLFAATVVTFSLSSLLPGDTAQAYLGLNATPERLAELRTELHLDKPLPVRYVIWISGVVQGDLGESIRHPGSSVAEVLARRFGVTALLVLYAQTIAIVTAISLAVTAAMRPGGRFDRLQTRMLYAALATPEFLVGSVLIVLFVSGLHIFPAIGYTAPDKDLLAHVRSMLLPAVTLAIPQTAVYGRLLRDDIGNVLKENFVLQARAKGLHPRRILLRHVLPPASFTLLTVFGLGTAQLLGGAVIVEALFSLPGVGSLLIDAVGARDYPMVQGTVLVMAVAFVVMTLLTDVMYGVLDPRVRSGAQAR